MNIFNSLGSNYDLKFALKALFAKNKESYSKNLKDFLEKKYQGKAILVYKGREAIGLALNILKLYQMSSRGSRSAGDVAIPSEERLLRHVPSGTWLRFARNDNLSYVAINGFTCYAVYKAIINEGYETEILDLPNTSDLNFSAETLQKSLKHHPKIKAVIIQNTLSYPCDIEKIAKICKENNIILIEDLAHSVGTVYENGKEAGTIGDFVVLSFSQDKIIDAVSGGALIIRNLKYQNFPHPHPLPEGEGRVRGEQQLVDRLYPLFTFIIRKTYPMGIGKIIHFFLKSFNLLSKPMNESFYTKYGLPNWYCSLVLNAFESLKKNLEHRKQIVNIYNSMLDKKIAYASTLRQVPYGTWLRYPIFVKNRKSLIKYLKNRGVYVSDIWYDDVDKSLPNSQIAANTILNLPTHKNVSENDARKIAQEVNLWLKSQ